MVSKSEIDVSGMLKFLLESWKIIIGVTIAFMVIAVMYNFIILRPTFTREIGISIPAEVDDRNLNNIVLILEGEQGEHSLTSVKSIKGSTVVKLYFGNNDKEILKKDSDEYKTVAIRNVNNYIINLERYKQDKKNIDEIKDIIKFITLSTTNEGDVNTKLASISQKLNDKMLIGQASIFSESKISEQPLRSKKINNVAAWTLFGFIAINAILIGKYYCIN